MTTSVKVLRLAATEATKGRPGFDHLESLRWARYDDPCIPCL